MQWPLVYYRIVVLKILMLSYPLASVVTLLARLSAQISCFEENATSSGTEG